MDKHPADTPERDWPTLHPQDDVGGMRPDRAGSDDERDSAERDSAERDGEDDQANDGDSDGGSAAD
jgi:hypothetical protein